MAFLQKNSVFSQLVLIEIQNLTRHHRQDTESKSTLKGGKQIEKTLKKRTKQYRKRTLTIVHISLCTDRFNINTFMTIV